MRRRASGFSLIEVVIAVAILAVLFATLYSVLFATSTAYTNMSQRGWLEERTRIALDEMSKELRMADMDTVLVTVTNGVGSVDFRRPTGYATGSDSITWGPTIRYQYEPSTVDANSNGLADEGRVVRIENGVSTVLCDYVKQNGFIVTQTGGNLLIQVTCVAADEKGVILESTLQTSITFRNRSS